MGLEAIRRLLFGEPYVDVPVVVEPEPPGPDVREDPQPRDPTMPRSFAEFVGQEEAVRLLKAEVAAAKREGRLLSHLLLYGPPGVGKTALAFILAEEMGYAVYESTGAEFPTQAEMIQTLGRVGELCANAGRPAVFLLDEVDGMARTASYPLHSLMTSGYVQWRGAKYGPANVTVLATTNHMARVHRALKSRFQEVVLIDYYSPVELAEIAFWSAVRMGFDLTAETALFIGENAAGEPRKVVRRILRTVANLLDGRAEADLGLVREALHLSGLRPKGLMRSQFDYLRFLASCEDGTAGVNSVAAFLAEDPEDVRGEHEPFLIRSGLAVVTRSGRKITEAGLRYLAEVPS